MDFIFDFLTPDVMTLLTSVLVVVIAIGILVASRAFHMSEAVTRYSKEIEIISDLAQDLIIRIAFPADNSVELAKLLAGYKVKSDNRIKAGLSYIDPRMLYLIDEVEKRAPYKVDFNVILDRAERLYYDMNERGELVGSWNMTDFETTALENADEDDFQL